AVILPIVVVIPAAAHGQQANQQKHRTTRNLPHIAYLRAGVSISWRAKRPPLTARRVRGTEKPSKVMTCKHRAILIVTRSVVGTSTSVAQERIQLECSEDEGHD